MLDCKELKRKARAINAKAQVNAYLFSLIFFLISLVLNLLRGYFNSASLAEQAEALFSRFNLPAFFDRLRDITASVASSLQHYPAAIVTFVLILVLLLNYLFRAGYIIYIMGIHRGERMDYGTLLEGFSFAGKIIFLNLFISLCVLLWSFLFIVPGIIAGYRYSFALYYLLENPERSVAEAIAFSRQQTRGHKLELFFLDLSFLGWDILTFLTAGILSVYVRPLKEQSWVCFFEQVRSEPAADPADPPENNNLI